MTAQHTPGPWQANEVIVNHKVCTYRIRNMAEWDEKTHRWIADIMSFDGATVPSAEIGQANAHLIAAAPQLLEQLEILLKEQIATRNAFYEGCSDADGSMLDDSDLAWLARADHIIYQAQTTIKKSRGQK